MNEVDIEDLLPRYYGLTAHEVYVLSQATESYETLMQAMGSMNPYRTLDEWGLRLQATVEAARPVLLAAT